MSLLLTFNKYTALGVFSFSIHHFYVLINKQSSLLNRVNYSLAILQTSHFYVPTCPINGANVPCSVPVFQLGMSVYQTRCLYFTLACKCAKRRASFSNIPLTKCWGKFLYFIVWKILHYNTWYHITHIVCTCIVYINCIIPYR